MLPSDDEPAPIEQPTTVPRSIEEQLAAIRVLRESLSTHVFDPDEIDAFKREGRR